MKHSIFINQKSCIDNGFDLDIIDLAIFDVMVFFANSPKCKTMSYEGKIYYWFSWKLFVSELPLIGIKTRDGIRKRISNLRDALLVEPHKDNQLNAMSWFCFGEKYDLMFSTTEYENMHPLHTTVCTPAYNDMHPLHTTICTIKDTIDKETIIKENTNVQNSIFSKKQEIESQFNEFWNSYNYKVARATALKAFEKAIKKTDIATMIESIAKYDLHLKKSSSEKFKKSKKHPATWLNSESWLDEYETSNCEPKMQSKLQIDYDF